MSTRIDQEAEIRSLLIAGLAGDEAAHRLFLAKVAALLRGFFRAKLRGGPDVEDLLQETLIALHTKRETYDPSYPASAWIYAIARYRLIDHIRRTNRRGISVPVDDADAEVFANPDADASDARKDVAHLLAQLPAKQRDAIHLTKLEDISVQDAADRLGLSVSDVKISVHRGLKALMRLIGEEPKP